MAKSQMKKKQTDTQEEKSPKSRKKEEKGAKSTALHELQEKYHETAREHEELKDKYLRLFAEFDNYKKRTVREKMELIHTAAENTISSLLPVLDDFDRAKKSADDESSAEAWTDGIKLVYNRLYNTLKNSGLEPMVSDGEVFDPEMHDAISEIPAPSDDLKGKVVDTIEKGYFLKEKLIRHAKVVVGK
jgi:molecular chaperone GrpE